MIQSCNRITSFHPATLPEALEGHLQLFRPRRVHRLRPPNIGGPDHQKMHTQHLQNHLHTAFLLMAFSASAGRFFKSSCFGHNGHPGQPLGVGDLVQCSIGFGRFHRLCLTNDLKLGAHFWKTKRSSKTGEFIKPSIVFMFSKERYPTIFQDI